MSGLPERKDCHASQTLPSVVLVRAGAVPVLVSLLTDPNQLRTLWDRLDGLLLPGGGDVHPARYGEPVHETCRRISAERDEIELALARWTSRFLRQMT